MRFFRFFSLGVISMLVVFSAVIWFAFPSSYVIQEEILIDAPIRNVFQKVNTLSAWQEWALANDTANQTFQYAFQGATDGEGAIYEWDGEGGDGRLQIIESKPFESIALRAVMQQGKFNSDIKFTFEKGQEQVKVIWEEQGDFGWNPLTRLTAYLLDFQGTMKENYRQSLEKLKIITEDAHKASKL